MQAGGQGFDSPRVHHDVLVEIRTRQEVLPKASARPRNWGRMYQGQATVLCKHREEGSIPSGSTNIRKKEAREEQ